VSLSPTLSKDEKVKQYIRKKTQLTVLKFWVVDGMILLYIRLISHSYEISQVMSLQILPTSL